MALKSWTVGKTLLTGVGALVPFFILSSLLSVDAASRLGDALDVATSRTAEKLNLALRIQQNAIALKGDPRRLLLAGSGDDATMRAESNKASDDTMALNNERLDQSTACWSSSAARPTWPRSARRAANGTRSTRPDPAFHRHAERLVVHPARRSAST